MPDKEYMKTWRESHRESCRLAQKKWYDKNKIKANNWQKDWRKRHPNYMKERGKYWANKIKLEVLIHYSGNPPRCVCCGETHSIFLTIDHIKDDGAKQRKELNLKSGYLFYKWLIKNNFPEGYQVLCFNCNYAKSHGGCPHVK